MLLAALLLVGTACAQQQPSIFTSLSDEDDVAAVIHGTASLGPASDADADAATGVVISHVATNRRTPSLATLRQLAPVSRIGIQNELPPGTRALTAAEIAASQTGGNAPGLSPSSLAWEGPIAPQANGNAGATFADSRFGTGPDYTARGHAIVGRLEVGWASVAGGTATSWSTCTASVINKALVITAAHCVFKFGQKAQGWPAFYNNQWQVSCSSHLPCGHLKGNS